MTTLGRTVLCVLAASHLWIASGQDGPTVNGGGKGATLPSTDVCGKRGDRFKRVVGGSDANPGMYPWVAALGYRTSNDSDLSWLCAASLVTDRHLITTVQCALGGVPTRYKLSVARLGVLDLNETSDDKRTPIDYEVESWTVHPEWNISSFQWVNSIAIITLKNKVTFSRLIQPICLPTLDDFKTKNFTGSAAYIAGWGTTQYRGEISRRLQQAQLRLWGQDECKAAYQGMSRMSITDNRVVCANGVGKDACQGDSGAPLMMPYGADSNYYLYGIVSYGYKCAEPKYPGVYTKVSEFTNWILENIK